MSKNTCKSRFFRALVTQAWRLVSEMCIPRPVGDWLLAEVGVAQKNHLMSGTFTRSLHGRCRFKLQTVVKLEAFKVKVVPYFKGTNH